MINKQIINKLISLQQNTYSIYSNFPVSCIIEDEENKLFLGVNYENSCFSAGICAERNAFGSWITNQGKKIVGIYIKGGDDQFIYPCGICRQVMNEFIDDDIKIYIVKNHNNIKIISMRELIPYSFSKKDLNNE